MSSPMQAAVTRSCCSCPPLQLLEAAEAPGESVRLQALVDALDGGWRARMGEGSDGLTQDSLQRVPAGDRPQDGEKLREEIRVCNVVPLKRSSLSCSDSLLVAVPRVASQRLTVLSTASAVE
jgi:hypothetical protein